MKIFGFDYIVVGAGSAGAALAARLSERPSTTVLLVEAGRDSQTTGAPAEIRSLNFLEIVSRGRHHWPTLHAQLTRTQEPRLYLQGRGLGGSSAINALGAIRGTSADYNDWAQQGCIGWSWEDVLPFFTRLENDCDYGLRPYHGRNGPVPIGRIPVGLWGSVARAFRTAALDLGLPWCEDINAPEACGVYSLPLNALHGFRVSSSDAYLEAARSRSNLQILSGALVDRVKFEGRRAIGLQILTATGVIFVEAGEIILCAGAIHSPAILMRSGIGCGDDLQFLGIKPAVDLPAVGQNLGEHPLVELRLRLCPDAQASSLRMSPHQCCLRASSRIDALNDISMYSANFSETVEEGVIGVSVMQPFSRGRVAIRSPNPLEEPIVQFNLLDDDRDLSRLRWALRMAFRIASHPAFSRVSEAVFAQDLTIGTLSDDASLNKWLCAHCEGHLHAAGTCRMGAVGDASSVVDPACKVVGVDALRVADSSIVPSLPRAPTHLTVVMIAEHLAELLCSASKPTATRPTSGHLS